MNQGKLEVVKQEMARVNVYILGISELKWTGTRPVEELDARIAARAERMTVEGAIEEVAALNHAALSPTAAKTLGLPQVMEHLAGRLSRADLAAAIALATRQYAKRQRTWLRREKWLTPVSGTAELLSFFP